MADPLDPSEVDALIGIRELIVEASRHVPDSTLGGRHAAVVLLDGGVEAAIATCLSRFGDAPKDAESLPKMHGRLMQSIGEVRRTIPGWRDAARLRRIRNLAQHHQVPPDAATLVSIEGKGVEYVEAIVFATFGRNLNDVVLTDSISSSKARTALGRIGELIRLGEDAEALSQLDTEFRRIRSEWDSARTQLFDSTPTLDIDDLGLGKMIESLTADSRDLASVAPFAPNLSEYVWFRRVLNIRAAKPRSQDTRRALNFVIGWVVRWEAFERVHQELAEQDRTAHFIRSRADGDGRLGWIDRPVVTQNTLYYRQGDGPTLALRGRVGAASEDDPTEVRRRWTTALSQACENHKRSSPDGVCFEARTSEITVGRISSVEKLETVLDEIETVFAEATKLFADYTERNRKWIEREESLNLDAQRLTSMLQSLPDTGSEVFSRVRITAGPQRRSITFVGGGPAELHGMELVLGDFRPGEDGLEWSVPDDATDESILAASHKVAEVVVAARTATTQQESNAAAFIEAGNAAIERRI